MELDADGGDEGDEDDGDDGEQSDDVDDCSPSSWQLLATGCNWMRASWRHKSYSWRHRLTQGGTNCAKKITLHQNEDGSLQVQLQAGFSNMTKNQKSHPPLFVHCCSEMP